MRHNKMTIARQNIVRILVLCMVMMWSVVGAWAEDGNAVVKMTQVNYNDADNALGEKDQICVGYNKITNGSVGFGNTSWGINNIGYIQVDASALHGDVVKATLTADISGSTDSKRATTWGVGYNTSTWSASMTYNNADKSITTLGGTVSSTSTKSDVFNNVSFDITGAFTATNSKVVTIVVYETAAAGGNMKNVNVAIQTLDASSQANVTVKWVCNESVIKQVTRVGVIGQTLSLNAEDKQNISATQSTPKYIYVSDDAAYQTIAGDGSTTVTINFREANRYTVNAKYNEEVLSTATVYEGNNCVVYVPYYQFVEDILYATPRVDKGTLNYGQVSLNNVLADTDINVSYTEDATQNAVFYSEAENISTLTPFSDGFTQIRMSNGAVGYAATEGTVIATLPAGKYTISSSSRAGTTRFYAGDSQIYELTSTGSVISSTSEEFTLDETTDIKVSAGSEKNYFDYVLIRLTSTTEYTVNYYLNNDHSTLVHTTKGVGLRDRHPIISHDNLVLGYTTYTYVSDNSSDVTINADGSTVVDVIVRRPPLHWTVVSSTGLELASGYGEMNQDLKIHYPRHVVNDRKQLYYSSPLSDNNREYALQFTLSKNDQVETVQYNRLRVNNVDVNNIELLGEGEDIPGATILNSGGFQTRTSNGAAGYSSGNIVLATGLRSGKYKLTINTYNGSGSSTTAANPYNFKVTIAGETIMSFNDNANGLTQSVSTEFGIKDESIQLVMPAGFAGDAKCGIDNFYLERVGDFVPTPTINRNLRTNYKVEVNKGLMMTLAASDVLGYQWYKWNGTAEAYATAKNAFEAGTGQESALLSSATLIENAKTNSYTYAAGDTPGGSEMFFCQVKGFQNNAYTVLATVTTIEDANLTSVMVPFYNEGYDKTSITGWNGTATSAVVNHAAQITNGATGGRDMYMQLSQEFDYAPVNDGTWSLDFDFQPTDNSPGTLSIYNKAYGIPTANTVVPDANAFFALKKNGENYDPYVNGVKGEALTLENGKWYHVHLFVEPNGTGNKITVSLTENTGRAIPFNASSTTVLATGMELGGIHCFMDRYANPVNYDDVILKVKSTDVLIGTDLPEFSEGNDDYYLYDGDGLNFDVPAATEFEWYVSQVAPSKTADGITAPKIQEDGSITWSGGTAFMTVESPVDRSSTSITKTNGVATVTDPEADGKHVVDVPTRRDGITDAEWFSTPGCYADTLLKSGYQHVQTVWDEATLVRVGDNNIYRYYPEATASGSHWHYLRQLWIPTGDDSGTAESDHVDYVWCVAKNALGDVTSKVAQITIYPIQPQIYLEEEYFTDDANGTRADMTLPAIYTFRTHGVKVHTNNLIFNTANLKVPYATRSYIHYKDKVDSEYVTYEPNTTVMGADTQWKNGETEWTGVISTTAFSGFDTTLEKNASVHGFYKSMPFPLPVDFVYGLMQMKGDGYHDVTKGNEHNSIAEFIIGPTDNSSLQATQDIHFDYGRYTAAEVQLSTVSEKTTWDWSKLPERKFLTYNKEKYTSEEDIKKYVYTIPNSNPAVTFVVDPETGLGGPVMGNEYVMANFYGYSAAELEGFPSDKVKLGLEVVNDPSNKCMQGNAFIIKPQHSGTLQLSFSATEDDEEIYLTLNYTTDQMVSYKASGTSAAHDAVTNITMTITDDMVNKEVTIKACKNSDDTSDQYFRLYSAIYTPDAEPVSFKEWVVDNRGMVASGGVDSYTETTVNSDGFVSLTTNTPNAVIKYKVLTGNDKDEAAITAFMSTEEYNNLEVQTYKEDVYVDYNVDGSGNYILDTNGEKIVRNKIGIHCPVNSTIFAWTEKENMIPSEVTWHKTNAAVYPVDMRFMKDFDTSTIDTQDKFDLAYWDESGKTHQSNLSSYTDLSIQANIDKLKSLSTPDAPKAWSATQYGRAFIDGVEYTEANFEKFFITHGTTIDIYINPKSDYEFAGWGAPSFDSKTNKVVDMMRSGAKAGHVHYHLLYDKAKAATTAGIAFLIANFTDRTEPFTAKMLMKVDTGDGTTYNIDMDVDDEDSIIAPIYHSAHEFENKTVSHWTDEYGLGDTETVFENYIPGEAKKIYEDTQIKPVYRDNAVADNYRGRTREMTATWWFTTDHHAQPLTISNATQGFSMPYVAPVRRHEIGTATEGAADDLWFDLPMTITPYTTGRVDNTIVPDWCSVGRGTTFTLPACPGAEVQMEVRSKLSNTATGTKFGGETPTLIKVKYKDDNEYTEVLDPINFTPAKTVESYVYTATYNGDTETLDIILGNDYSYIRNISLTLPVVISKRDAALVTLEFSELADIMRTPYNEGHTGDGYDYDNQTRGASLFTTHYSGERNVIYYDGVSTFMVNPATDIVPANVPYVNGTLGYAYSNSNDEKGTFIVGPFRSITHIRYKQGSSILEGGNWNVSVARHSVDWDENALTSDESDPRRTMPDIPESAWSPPMNAANSTTPEWVEMNIEANIGKAAIDADDYDSRRGDIWLRFQANRPNIYLFGLEFYGVASTSEQQAILETNVMVAENDDATTYEPSFIAGDIFHFPYLLRLDEDYNPISSLQDTDNKVLQFNEGREVTLTANANVGFEFLKWVQEDKSGNWEEVSRENPYKFNIDYSRQIRAVFVPRGIINYTNNNTKDGLVPEPVQTNRNGGFTVAENRSLFSGEGQSLRSWQDTHSQNSWYHGDGVRDSIFAVSTDIVGHAKASAILRSRAETGVQIDVTPHFTANQLNLLDVVGRIGTTARWPFGKKNGAPTMEGNETTPRLVTQASVTGSKDILNETTHEVFTVTVVDTIDVNIELKADINNSGRADAYATVQNGGQFTMPATRGMKIEIHVSNDTPIEYSIDGGSSYTRYTEAFRYMGDESAITLQLRNTDYNNKESFELEYIQATYRQRAQTPILSMQKVDVIGANATNNIQVQVQTKSNPTAVRLYTLDGSDPTYIIDGIKVIPTGNTNLVRGNYITINEAQIDNGTTLKVLSVCTDRADSEIATLDLKPYDPNLGLATYVYDSRIINIHEDQIFRKLMAEHEGHFNLLSYDLNPSAAVIPDVITDHTTVFVTSDAVRNHLMTALTTPSDPAAHGQTFNVHPLIVGTPLYISWKQSANAGEWLDISWVKPTDGVTPEPASNTVTYTEAMTMMKNTPTRVDPSKTYAEYYNDQIQANGGEYILTFFDNMLMQTRTVTINEQEVTVNDVCISNTMDNAPENLSHNGTQLVFNATELLTRITMVDGTPTPADVTTFNSTILTLMAPTSHPQLTSIKLSDTFEITDQVAGPDGKVSMTPQMLSALSDGLAVMPQTYLSNDYPQFTADRDDNTPGKGNVEIINVETWLSDADGNIAYVEKIGAQGVKDLASIITVTDPAFSGVQDHPDYTGDANFKRVYRVEYNVPIDSLTFRKEDDAWICNESDLFTLTESKIANQPSYKILGPINMGIKDVCFDGYAIAPADKFENGELIPDEEGQHDNSIWIRGEIYDANDGFKCPTAYEITGSFIPEYPVGTEEKELHGLTQGQWMETHFPWGFKDCNQLAFTLTNINEYVGDIKIRFYRREAESPKLIETNIYDNMTVPANGEFTMTFNSVMHQIRVPGRYDDTVVEWTAHIIPDDLGNGISYGDIKNDNSLIDRYDLPKSQILLSAEGGSNTLTFHYWHLEEGKTYWLHIPFHILRNDMGESRPYVHPDEEDQNEYEKKMSWTDYKAVPYFDIPFTVGYTRYNYGTFNYIVNNDNWWDAYKDPTHAAGSMPTYAEWDGDFATGIQRINAKADNAGHFYMHVQKNLDGIYTLGDGDAGKIEINKGNFSIVGEGCDSTMIYANPNVVSGKGTEGLRHGNNNSTLLIDGDDVYLQDMTIENGQQGNGDSGQEYPALLIRGKRNSFYGLDIKAYEESFATFGTLGYLENCKISGYGDFIVGSGDVWLEKCKLLLRNKNMINLCAPSTKASEQWGFVFNDCHIDREEGASNVIDHNWTLARPWSGYDEEVLKSPAATFINTKIAVLPTNTGYGSLTDNLRLRFHEHGTYKNNIENPAPLSMRSVANCKPTLDSDYPVLTEEGAEEYSISNVFGRDNDGYDPQALTRQAIAPVLTNDGMVLHWKADRRDFCYLVYYLGDGEKPDWENAMMFCCVPGTEDEEAYCYLTNHKLSPIFRTGNTDTPIAFSELWYGRRKRDPNGADYDGDVILGMGKESPSRLWFAVRAANQMGGLSPMSNPLEYHAAHQYRTTITEGGVLKGDDSGNAFSTIYLDFQALAPKGVKAYALTNVTTTGGDETGATTLTFTRVSDSENPDHQDIVYANQGYLIYGPYGKDEGLTSKDHVFIETTSQPDIDLTSYLDGTVGEFLDTVSVEGYGELNGVNGDFGWSIAPEDYTDVPRVNISAYTLQNYSNMLGFYKYNKNTFAHHRAYLDTDMATKLLMENEGLSRREAENRMSRGMRFVVREPSGEELVINPVLIDTQAAEGIYDLMGRRVTDTKRLQPGHIYIINGKKVLFSPSRVLY